MDKKTILCCLIILSLIAIAIFAYPYILEVVNSFLGNLMSSFQENMVR